MTCYSQNVNTQISKYMYYNLSKIDALKLDLIELRHELYLID